MVTGTTRSPLVARVLPRSNRAGFGHSCKSNLLTMPYLGAAVTMASLFKKSPVGNTYTAGLPADVAQHLQSVAWETVQSFRP